MFSGQKNLYDEGYFFVTGRKRDLVKIGIYKVSTKEVEGVLCRFDGVLDAAVIGVLDEYFGESMIAFIVLDRKAICSDEAIVAFCSQRLPRYKVPTRIIFIAVLPKNDAGKISKQKLLQAYNSNHDICGNNRSVRCKSSTS